MSMLLDINAEAGLLYVVVTGEFSLAEAERTFLQMLEAVAVHKSAKVLLDGRKLFGEPATMERFYYGEFAARSAAEIVVEGAPALPQFAYVLVEPLLDPTRFGETVAVNRGMNVKAFDNPEAALQWLGIAPANK
jgi:hypothetical protein